MATEKRRTETEMVADILYRILKYTYDEPTYIAFKYSYNTGKSKITLRKTVTGDDIPVKSYDNILSPWGLEKKKTLKVSRQLSEQFMEKDGVTSSEVCYGHYPMLFISFNKETGHVRCNMLYRPS